MSLYIFIAITCIGLVNGQYEVPEAEVQPLVPRGFTVSIPDEEGIKLFAFHGNINEVMNGREAGLFSRDILRAKNGRWTFIDRSTKLKLGDVINYWTYVEYFDGSRKLGYSKDDQSFTVTEFFADPFFGFSKPTAPPSKITTGTPIRTTSANSIRTTTASPVITTSANPVRTTTASPIEITTEKCLETLTRINGQKSCAGKLIFNENFSEATINDQIWKNDIKFAGGPDYEFVLYKNEKETLFISKNKLNILPMLADDKYGEKFVTNTEGHDLGASCTSKLEDECKQKPQAYIILPPVLSASINTKASFSFLYGTIEIRAKLPKGDWIYPELFLNPKNEDYGTSDYESGQIRIAFLNGNYGLNKKLSGGCILGVTQGARTFAMRTKDSNVSWTTDFHIYKLKWEPENISLYVDDELYGQVYPSAGGFATQKDELKLTAADKWKTGLVFAPFDKEMFISIGVGVGGHSFPDSDKKFWVNNDPKSQKKFYREKDKWLATWGQDSALKVDYVRVIAL